MNTYRKAFKLFSIFFVVLLGVLIVFNFYDLVQKSWSSILYLGISAFIGSCFFTFGMVSTSIILSPINAEDSVKERMQQLKEHNIYFKLVLLFFLFIPIFLIILWGMLWVSFPNILHSFLPFWQVLLGGLMFSIVLSLLAIPIIKYWVRNYGKNGDQGKKRFSFRDS